MNRWTMPWDVCFLWVLLLSPDSFILGVWFASCCWRKLALTFFVKIRADGRCGIEWGHAVLMHIWAQPIAEYRM